MKKHFLLSFFVLYLLMGCDQILTKAPVPAGEISMERIQQADQQLENWMTLGRDFGESHYSPLDQINTNNVNTLGLAWEFDARTIRGRTQRGLEATPIVVDGKMYTSGAWGVVYALNAKTGELLWRYDPEVDGAYDRWACCDVVNRGVQVWQGKVYVGTTDGFLVCLNAETGEELWKEDTFIDRSKGYSITSAPRVAKNVVVIGNSGGEFGVRGYITAYDLETGELAWRFFIVPGDPKNGYEHPEMEMASKTWDPDSHWESGGGGTAWGDMAYDPDLNLLYVGTGNSSPYPIWFRSPKGGDNLFLVSILAINPDDGRLKWHYQTTPGEIWDYTATQHMILADLEIEGEQRKILMQAPKNGFFYVLDRATGELLSAEKYVRVNWASHVDLKTGRPVLTEEGNYRDRPRLVYPSMAGGHNWMPMSYSPQTGLVYIPAIDVPFLFVSQKSYEFDARDLNMGVTGAFPPIPESLMKYVDEDTITYEERLIAWDPVQQKEVWRMPLTSDWNGGVLSTGGGLVFQGTAAGFFNAHDAYTGKKLHSIFTGTGIMAGAMTYRVDGEQYIAVMAGFGGAFLSAVPEGAAARSYENNGRILAFKLGGSKTPLPADKVIKPVSSLPDIQYSAANLEAGARLYNRFCARCHGGFGEEHTSLYPDLAKMDANYHTRFKEIVLEGVLERNGMASFEDLLSERDVENIHAYLLREQSRLLDHLEVVGGR